MANAKIQPFTSLDQSKHHCYTLSTTCTLFKLASEVGPRTLSGYGRISIKTDFISFENIHAHHHLRFKTEGGCTHKLHILHCKKEDAWTDQIQKTVIMSNSKST